MAFVEKRGPNRWRARYRIPGGGERSKTFDRKIDAERWLAAQQADRSRGDWTDPQRGRMTFAAWVERWGPTTVHLRDSTRALNAGVTRKYLVPRFGDWPLDSITIADVQQMLREDLDAGTLSNSAVRRHVIVLSTVLQGAVADGRIRRNPCEGVKLPAEASRKMRFLEPGEIDKLAAAVNPQHYRPLILTAAYMGLRWGELAGLQLEHVDLLRRQIRVDRQLLEVNGVLTFGPPKTGAGVRTVSMPRSLVDVLAPHLGATAVQTSGLVFPAPSGVPMRRGNFRSTWRRACIAAGFDPDPKAVPEQSAGPLTGLVFHELRHTAAALAIAAGAHPLVIKERLGHASITVTMDRYGGLFPSLDKEVADGLDEMFGTT